MNPNDPAPNSSDHPAEADSTRARLLQAAAEVFAEYGYYAATVREICTRADVNVAAINYHFGDKMELYTEVLHQSVSVVSSVEKEAIGRALDRHEPPEVILKLVINAMLQAICGTDRPGRHLRLMAHELAQPTPAISRVINEETRPNYDWLRGFIGEILGLPPDHEKTRLCTHSVIGQVVHYAMAGPILVQLWPEMKRTPEQLERVASHIAEFSLAYLQKRGKAGAKLK